MALKNRKFFTAIKEVGVTNKGDVKNFRFFESYSKGQKRVNVAKNYINSYFFCTDTKSGE